MDIIDRVCFLIVSLMVLWQDFRISSLEKR